VRSSKHRHSTLAGPINRVNLDSPALFSIFTVIATAGSANDNAKQPSSKRCFRDILLYDTTNRENLRYCRPVID
jgi:hypothetical protein